MTESDETVFVIAPCKVCGSEIEDEGPVDQDWVCMRCWPAVERGRLETENVRLEAQKRELQAELTRVQLLYDEETQTLNEALRASVEREKYFELAVKELRAQEINGLVERAAYIARLETALRLVIDVDMTNEYFEKCMPQEQRTRWDTPRTIALAALDRRPPRIAS